MNSTQLSRFFDYQAKTWDNRPVDMLRIQHIMNFCDIKAGQKILDVACGTGVLFKTLLAYSPECVLGVDISERMVQKAMQKVKDSRLEVIVQDFVKLDVKGFDRVVIYNAYPHFIDKDKLAKKTFDVLRLGGRFIVAHNMGRKMINAVHDKNKAGKFSTTLNSADKE